MLYGAAVEMQGGDTMIATTEKQDGRLPGPLGAMKGATGPLIGLVLLCLFLTFATDTFFSVRNFLNILDTVRQG